MSRKRNTLTISKPPFDAVIFDLDGVVTKTAKVHAASWKELFDRYLERCASQGGEPTTPFDRDRDYRRYVDGKPRYDGVKSFLESRGITLPRGTPDDPPDAETVCGLGNAKNRLFREHLGKQGVEVYPGAVDLIRRLRKEHVMTAIVSSSKNCKQVLDAANIANLFDTRVDGVDSDELGLEGKPAPDIFIEAARRLGVNPGRAVVFEDAIAGVEAGRRGRFGRVIGVHRTGHREDLLEHGADIAVKSLSEIVVGDEAADSDGPQKGPQPAMHHLEEIRGRIEGKRLAVFLDYDGTLTPIVDSPEKATLSGSMRDTVKDLADSCTVAIISGRDLPDVQALVGIEDIFYAGSHGFDISGPKGGHMQHQQGKEYLPALDKAEQGLRERLGQITGVLVERKKFSVAVHYRKVESGQIGAVEEAVDQVIESHDDLRKSGGKKVFEVQPAIDWHKGKGLLWLLDKLDLDDPDVLPIYIGDDTTDEDAFQVLEGRGIGFLVSEKSRATAATYALKDPNEVGAFLKKLAFFVKGGKE